MAQSRSAFRIHLSKTKEMDAELIKLLDSLPSRTVSPVLRALVYEGLKLRAEEGGAKRNAGDSDLDMIAGITEAVLNRKECKTFTIRYTPGTFPKLEALWEQLPTGQKAGCFRMLALAGFEAHKQGRSWTINHMITDAFNSSSSVAPRPDTKGQRGKEPEPEKKPAGLADLASLAHK